MKLSKINTNKKAAFELSVSVMIVIVLAITLLIFGLIFIRNIFGAATENFDVLSNQVRDEINRIFTDEGKKIVIFLGEDKTANIRADGESFNIVVAARTLAGTRVTGRDDIQYKMELDDTARVNCLNTLGRSQTENLFLQRMDEWNNMEVFEGDDSARTAIQMRVPEGTALCSQKVFITVRDRTVDVEGDVVAGDSFIINVLRKGVF